jgi:hypothetical protein
MKKFFIITMMSFMALSCQKSLIQRQTEGQLSLQLENSPVIEMVTKAEAADVSVDDFNVYVSSKDATFTYVYRDMPSVITVPVGFYTVSAENVTETQSLTLPDKWGQVRYAGTSEEKEVAAGLNPTPFNLTCKMVNTAVSVVFGENIDKHFTDYKITAYTVDTRKLEYTPSNTSGESSVVGYFNSGVALNYVFSGTYIIDNEPMTITGSKMLLPATHLHLTFRMSEQNGAVGKPQIVVDATCDDVYESITVDPSEGGSFVTE